MSLEGPSFPWFTQFYWVVAAFFLSLLLCHLVLIRVLQIGTIAWKKVDYIWLSMAFFGLISAVGTGREYIAKNFHEIETYRLQSTRNSVEQQARFGTSDAVCRTFVRSEFSPPAEEFDRSQKEFDAECLWFKNTYEIIKNLPVDAKIDEEKSFGARPDGGFRDIYRLFSNSIAQHNAEVVLMSKIEIAGKSTDFELFIKFMGPFAIALALALRMTKVTAEIRSDIAKAKREEELSPGQDL